MRGPERIGGTPISGKVPQLLSPLKPLLAALPAGAECRAEAAEGSGAAPAGAGPGGAAGGGWRGAGAAPLARPRRRPAAEARPLGARGGRGGIRLSIPAISRAWEPGKQNALPISSRR